MSASPRLQHQPAQPARPLTRKAVRRPMRGLVVVRSSHGDRITAQLHDFSAFGCNIISDAAWLRIGSFIAIRLDEDHTVQGIVRWVRGESCGVEFLRALPWATAEALAIAF